MSLQYSVDVNNARLDSIETTIGTAAIMRIRSGAMPATCATADAGTILSAITLPADWLLAAAAGVKAKSGTWSDAAADAAGLAGHFRVYDSAGTTCHIQGLCSQAWAASTAYVLNQQVNNGGLVYRATTAGTSAGSGGPTGTGTGIADGTAVWNYVGTVDMVIDNTSFGVGQTFTVNTFQITASNA
jgi:hypothetical protein